MISREKSFDLTEWMNKLISSKARKMSCTHAPAPVGQRPSLAEYWAGLKENA